MFKKIGVLDKIKGKATQVREAAAEVTKTSLTDSLKSKDMAQKVQEAALQLFQRVKLEANDAVNDDEKFFKAVDFSYDRLPFQVKVFLRRKRFHKIMLKLRERYMIDKGSFTGASSLEIIQAEVSAEE